MDSNPSAKDTNWIQLSNNGEETTQEFYFDKQIEKMSFKLQINCSNSCWRSMVTNDDEVILAIRCYGENKLVYQVNLFFDHFYFSISHHWNSYPIFSSNSQYAAPME